MNRMYLDSWREHPEDYKLLAFTFDDGPVPAKDTRIGATGTDGEFKYPYLMNSLHFFDKKAKDLIAKFGGNVTNVEDAGKKRLAYEIQKMKEEFLKTQELLKKKEK